MTMNNNLAKPNLCLVQCYYGCWPTYWPLWAQSVAANPRIKFILVTDLPLPDYVPSNVIFVKMSITGVLERLGQILGFNIRIAGYHKLCDFRPFYGLAFRDFLDSFDYWGYCDMDVVFGDLTPLINAASRGYDVISPWTYTVGHCTLLRNTKEVNEKPFCIPNLQRRYGQISSTFCDEGAFYESCVRKGGLSFYGAKSVAEEWSQSRCFLNATVKPPSLLWGLEWERNFSVVCEEGRVTVNIPQTEPHEVLYFHFMAAKANRFWQSLAGKEKFPFTFMPFGFFPGAVSANELETMKFRLRSAMSRLRTNVYHIPRLWVPPKAVETLKKYRAAVRGLRRT